MSSLNKITAILFSILLLYICTNTDDYRRLITSKIPISESDDIISFFSADNFYLDLPYRQGERLSTACKDLPVSRFKNNSYDLYYNYLQSEIRKFTISENYQDSAETIYPNLTSSDIVFPFHYFL